MTRRLGWLTNLPAAGSERATSSFVMFAYISERNIKGMLVGTAIAFALISCSLILALRSVRLGLISLIPNMVPAGYGLWDLGAFGG